MSFQCTEAFVALATHNFEDLVNFYTHFLSQNPSNHINNVYAEFQLAGLKLGIFKPKESHLSEFNDSFKSSMSLCLEVKDLVKKIVDTWDLGHAECKSLFYSPSFYSLLMGWILT